MSDFINTIDALGDDVVVSSIIDRSITELYDDNLKELGWYALAYCDKLEELNLPNAEKLNCYSCTGCTSLKSIYLPNVLRLEGNNFSGCTSLVDVYLPNCTYIGYNGNAVGFDTFAKCSSLVKIVLPKLEVISANAFTYCSSLLQADFPSLTSVNGGFGYSTLFDALILRNETVVCTLGNVNNLNYTQISNGTGYIYVPRALLSDDDETKDYRRATNWSNFASKFRALEDWTSDGTVNGPMCRVKQNIFGATTSNTEVYSGMQFSTTLTPIVEGNELDVKVMVGGVDVTNSAYDGNGNICVSGVTGDIEIYATIKDGFVVTPYNGSEVGELPAYRFNVAKGQVITITYYLTKVQGYVYDGRSCGLGSQLKNNVVNEENSVTITIPKDGTITFSNYHAGSLVNGTLSSNSNDRLYGKYYKVSVNVGG